MGWVKLDDGLCMHVKTFTVLDLASIGLWTLCLSYCGHEETDGFVPEAYMAARVPRDDPDGACHKLLSAGWIEKVDGGYWIPQYLDYNPSRADMETKRAAVRKQRSEAGKRGAASRWHGKPDGKRDGEPSSSPSSVPLSTVDGPVPLPLKKSSKEDQEGNDAVRVFEHWQKVLSPNARFTQGRRDKVRARLKNYPAGRILRAIDGCAASGFHVDNKYVDLTLICRSDEKLEQFESMPLKAERGMRNRDGTKTVVANARAQRTVCRRCDNELSEYQANTQSGMCDPCYEAHVEKLTGPTEAA